MQKTVLTVKESDELKEIVQAELKEVKAEKAVGVLLENSIKSNRRISVEGDRDSH